MKQIQCTPLTCTNPTDCDKIDLKCKICNAINRNLQYCPHRKVPVLDTRNQPYYENGKVLCIDDVSNASVYPVANKETGTGTGTGTETEILLPVQSTQQISSGSRPRRPGPAPTGPRIAQQGIPDQNLVTQLYGLNRTYELGGGKRKYKNRNIKYFI
jgi:hypothetical protein